MKEFPPPNRSRIKKRPPGVVAPGIENLPRRIGGSDDFPIYKDPRKIKKPTQKEIDAMRQREIIRKYPHTSI